MANIKHFLDVLLLTRPLFCVGPQVLSLLDSLYLTNRETITRNSTDISLPLFGVSRCNMGLNDLEVTVSLIRNKMFLLMFKYLMLLMQRESA